MSMISSVATSASMQKQSATATQAQVAVLKKAMDTQKQMGADLLKLLEASQPPIQSANPAIGSNIDIYV